MHLIMEISMPISKSSNWNLYNYEENYDKGMSSTIYKVPTNSRLFRLDFTRK